MTARKCKYKEIDWFVYSEQEQEAVRRTRRTKSRASPPKVKKMNIEYSRKYFRWLLFNNFNRDDFHLTLTFAEHYSTDEAKKAVNNYIRRLKRLYGKCGIELKYLLVREDKRSGARLHWHMVLNSGDIIDRDDIENLWKLGWANADRLKPDANDGLFGLSRYLTKSMKYAEKNERSWSASQNLLRPEKNPSLVTDDYRISKKRMRQVQEAARNNDAPRIKKLVESIYKGFELVDNHIGTNEVTGRPFARFCLRRKE